MFHASRALSASTAAQYYEAEFRRGDYYTHGKDADIEPGRWCGRGAADLGLSGVVRGDDFTALLEGRAPAGVPLVQAQQATGKRRAGWDFTCSADKTVSIAALVFEDPRLVQAHDDAVRRAVTELERFVQTRAHGGAEIQATGCLVGATFRHESSRALDPQLHTHVVLLNVTRRADGEWRAVEARGVFQAQRYATAVYRAEMAHAIQQLGYRLELRQDTSLGIAGFTREQIDAFSQRRAQVVERARELGGTTADVGQQAALNSRAAKALDVDPAVLLRNWQATAHEIGLAPERLHQEQGGWRGLAMRLLGRREPTRVEASPDLAADVAVSQALAHLTERQAAFRVDELERVALEVGAGYVRLDDVRAAIDRRRDLVRAAGVITTQDAIDRERAIVQYWRAGQRAADPVPLERLRPGLAGEQLAAARHILGSTDRVIGVEGKAGAGKSHMLAPVVEAFQADGWLVRGLAPTTAAAAVLREYHLPATTIARFLREPEEQDRAGQRGQHSGAEASRPQLWIVDEAGLVSSRQMEALLRRAHAVGAKVVLVGDRMQHKAIEAGRPFALLVDAGMKTARLDRIQRQRDPKLRAAVQEAARGNAARAVLELARQGRVVERAGRDERLRFVAERYMALDGTRLVTTATNDDRRDVNAVIRQARIHAGQVEAGGTRVEVLVAKDLTSAQRKHARSYDVGDHVTFRSASRVYGVEAGARGRVLAADLARNRVRVQIDGGQVVEYEPRRLSGVTVARVEERRMSRGDRIEFRAPDRDQGIVNGQLAELLAVDERRRRARVRLEGSDREVTLDLRHAQPLDLGYASTSYRSQGRTVDHVIDLQNSRAASREGLYVGTSRGRESVLVVTDDHDALVQRLEQAVTPEPRALDVERAAGIDAVRPLPGVDDLRPVVSKVPAYRPLVGLDPPAWFPTLDRDRDDGPSR